MYKDTLSDKISYAEQEIHRLEGELFAIQRCEPGKYPENFKELSMEAALRAERLTCFMRRLVFGAQGSKKAEYLSSAASAQGVEISCHDDIMTIMLPAQLPKRRRGNSEFLVDPLFFALSEYTMAYHFQRLDQAVVSFVHIYDDEGRVRDYDNIESKQILDVIAMFALRDDSGRCCDVFHTTDYGPLSRTEIHIMDKDRFHQWLIDSKAPLD